jgi:hypothetical protein
MTVEELDTLGALAGWGRCQECGHYCEQWNWGSWMDDWHITCWLVYLYGLSTRGTDIRHKLIWVALRQLEPDLGGPFTYPDVNPARLVADEYLARVTAAYKEARP